MRPFGNPIRLPVQRDSGLDTSPEPTTTRRLSTESLYSYVDGFTRLLQKTVFSLPTGQILDLAQGSDHTLALIREAAKNESNIFLIGNGGSSAVASHVANDFCNTSGLRAFTFTDQAMLTCFTNDYGYANAYALLLARQARQGDLLIAISSSGASQNIINAIRQMRALDGHIISLTGFGDDNAVRHLGDINVWLDSREYGMVETGHLLVMHYLADRLSQETRQRHGTTKSI